MTHRRYAGDLAAMTVLLALVIAGVVTFRKLASAMPDNGAPSIQIAMGTQ
jgi:hypothetical protein